MNQEMVPYEVACRAIGEAKSIDDAMQIADRAEALRVYARRAKNRALEIDCVEIRIRAERRLGEMLVGMKESGGEREIYLAMDGYPQDAGMKEDAITDVTARTQGAFHVNSLKGKKPHSKHTSPRSYLSPSLSPPL